jgi:hypothetical protein
MPHGGRTSEEIVRLGEERYQRELQGKVEPLHEGKFLVLDVDTGDYEIDADEVAALRRAMARRPDGARFIKRIGYPAAHRLGGRMFPQRP